VAYCWLPGNKSSGCKPGENFENGMISFPDISVANPSRLLFGANTQQFCRDYTRNSMHHLQIFVIEEGV
jgi:hypothetical protein